MRKLLLFTLAATLPAICSAQAFEAWIGGGVSKLSDRALGIDQAISGSNVELQDGWRINFRLGLNSGRWIGHELMYAYNRTNWKFTDLNAEQGSAAHQGGYNFLIYATPEGKARIRPFATGGVHFANFAFPGYSATQGGGSTKFGFNYGAGIKVRVSEIFGIRADFRQYNTGKPDFGGIFLNQSGRLKQNEISIGIGVML